MPGQEPEYVARRHRFKDFLCRMYFLLKSYIYISARFHTFPNRNHFMKEYREDDPCDGRINHIKALNHLSCAIVLIGYRFIEE